mmetsp:Transcript_32464/g.81348  ORF Transcript_32464/g.81348 Transcript_32464/m.81348 type:complete len:275 (-) Transcript_32464:176-1000(-)
MLYFILIFIVELKLYYAATLPLPPRISGPDTCTPPWAASVCLPAQQWHAGTNTQSDPAGSITPRSPGSGGDPPAGTSGRRWMTPAQCRGRPTGPSLRGRPRPAARTSCGAAGPAAAGSPPESRTQRRCRAPRPPGAPPARLVTGEHMPAAASRARSSGPTCSAPPAPTPAPPRPPPRVPSTAARCYPGTHWPGGGRPRPRTTHSQLPCGRTGWNAGEAAAPRLGPHAPAPLHPCCHWQAVPRMTRRGWTGGACARPSRGRPPAPATPTARAPTR